MKVLHRLRSKFWLGTVCSFFGLDPQLIFPAAAALAFFLSGFLLVFRIGILVLLVLRDEIVHVGLGLSELHLVHVFTGVPMEESLSSEHGCELLADTLEHILNGSG